MNIMDTIDEGGALALTTLVLLIEAAPAPLDSSRPCELLSGSRKYISAGPSLIGVRDLSASERKEGVGGEVRTKRQGWIGLIYTTTEQRALLQYCIFLLQACLLEKHLLNSYDSRKPQNAWLAPCAKENVLPASLP